MRILKWLNEHLEDTILMIFLLAMVLVLGLQVVMRYIFNSSLTWSEELTRYLFVWSTFISISFCFKHDSSIKIDQFFKLFPKKSQKLLDTMAHIIMIFFMLVLFYQAVLLTNNTMQTGQVSPAMGLPVAVVQLSTVLGFGLSIIRLIQNLIKLFRPSAPTSRD